MKIYLESVGIALTIFGFAYLAISIASGTFNFSIWTFDQRYWFGFFGGVLPLIFGIAFGMIRKVQENAKL